MPRMEHIGNGIWTKLCKLCGRSFEVSADTWNEAQESMGYFFSMHGATYDKLGSYCRSCTNDKAHGRESIGHRDDLLKMQGNRCPLCDKEISFDGNNGAHVDHDHKTGITRSILCGQCNTNMGVVDKDEWLEKAIKYRDLYRG